MRAELDASSQKERTRVHTRIMFPLWTHFLLLLFGSARQQTFFFLVLISCQKHKLVVAVPSDRHLRRERRPPLFKCYILCVSPPHPRLIIARKLPGRPAPCFDCANLKIFYRHPPPLFRHQHRVLHMFGNNLESQHARRACLSPLTFVCAA